MSARQGCGQVILAVLFMIVACLVFAAFAGAMVRTGEIPLYGPRLTGVEPDLNAPFIPTTPITFSFDQPMNTASVKDSLWLRPPAPGDLLWNHDRTQVSFVPNQAGWEPGTTYTVRLEAGAKAGTIPRPTTRSMEWVFSLPPLLDGLTPPVGEEDQGAWPLLQATFNYSLDCDATLATFSIRPDAVGEFECAGQSLIFSPTLPLEPGTTYIAKVESTYLAHDPWPRAGLRWEFQTASALTVVDASPADGDSLTDLWTPVHITFSRPVVADSAETRFSLTYEDGSEVAGQAQWAEGGSVLTFQPESPLAPDTLYQFALEAGVRDELGFQVSERLHHSFSTEPMLESVMPRDAASGVPLNQGIRVSFTRPMDQASAAIGLTFVPALEGEVAWEENTLVFTPRGGLAAETQYQATVSADARDASGAPLAEPYSWSFTSQPFLLDVRPRPGTMLTSLQQPLEFTFALPMDRASVQSALTILPATASRLVWSNGDRTVSIQPQPAWLAGVDYEVTLSRLATTAGGYRKLVEDHTLAFATSQVEIQFGEGPNVQVMDVEGTRAFQFVAQGADVVDFRLYTITPTQFLDLYSSGFRGIGPQEPRILDTTSLTPTAEWRAALTPLEDSRTGTDWQPAEASIPGDVPAGLYLLTSPQVVGIEGPSAGFSSNGLLVALTRHALVLKRALAGSGSRSQAELLAWDIELSGGGPVISATVRLYDRDGSFLAEGLTDEGGLLRLNVSGDPGPLLVLSDKEGDLTACGLSNEWSEEGWWWWWSQPPSRPLHTIYSYTDRPIYRPAQTVFFKDFVRADDDVSYTLPAPDLPVTLRLRDARDNIAASQVLTPTAFGTVHGEFQLADEPMLGVWNLESEVDGTITRQPLKVEEYRKPEYEVSVHTPQKAYVHGEAISVTVEAVYYFGQPVAAADVVLLVYPTYPEDYFGGEEPSFGYPIFSEQGRLDPLGRWTVLMPTEDVFQTGSRSRRATLALEATVTDESGQSVSSYQMVLVQHTSQGLTLVLEKHGYQPGEAISLSAIVRDRDGEPVAGSELIAQVLGWDEREVARSTAASDSTGQALFSLQLAEQGWYEIQVQGTDDGGREMQATDYVWIYDPTGQAPWYQSEWGGKPGLSVTTDRTTYAVDDEAQILVQTPVSGPALLTFERGKTHDAQPITLVSGTNLITIPVQADYAPNVHVTVNQFGPPGSEWWEAQSRPEAQLQRASAHIVVPMADRLLTVTLTTDQDTYAPGDEATFHVQVTDHEGDPVTAEVSLAVVDEAIYALAEDMSIDPFDVFYAPRPNVVRTFDSLRPTRWLFPEGPGLGGDGEGEGGAPRRDFLDTATWAPTVVTDEGGEAAITFRLPDNLTEWRALARAITTDTLVGQATASLVVSKDIVVRPLLPRFLIQGDAITLTAVIHNYTGRDVSATVPIYLEGLTLLGDRERVVHVPSGGSAVADWPVLAEEPGEARVNVQVRAAFGARQAGYDAVELPLTVHPLAIPEVTTFAGTLTPDRPTETVTITLPADAIEGLSRLEINLAPSVAPGLLHGLEYLIDYPFG
jgi:hypothetical protein